MNKAYISEWLDTEKEKLEETAEDLKEAYRNDAERVSRSAPQRKALLPVLLKHPLDSDTSRLFRGIGRLM